MLLKTVGVGGNGNGNGSQVANTGAINDQYMGYSQMGANLGRDASAKIQSGSGGYSQGPNAAREKQQAMIFNQTFGAGAGGGDNVHVYSKPIGDPIIPARPF